MPALSALMSGWMMRLGGTRRSRIATRLVRATRTPAAIAEIHSPTGMKLKRMMKNTIAAPAIRRMDWLNIVYLPFRYRFTGYRFLILFLIVALPAPPRGYPG